MATQTATCIRIFSARRGGGKKQTTTTNTTTTFSRNSRTKTRTAVTTTTPKRKRKTCATSALFGGELTNLDLNDVTTLCANGAFLSLFVASTVYGTKAVFFPDEDEDEKKEDKHKDKEVKVNVERTALQLSNVALIFAGPRVGGRNPAIFRCRTCTRVYCF